jgi:hypothetical protein
VAEPDWAVWNSLIAPEQQRLLAGDPAALRDFHAAVADLSAKLRESGVLPGAPSEGLARLDLRSEAPQPRDPDAPVNSRQVRATLNELRKDLGGRMNFLLADSRRLPIRYRRGLTEAGLTPENFQAFYDKDLNEWVVNPRNIKTLGQLNDAIIRNFLPNTFAGQIRIHPVDSFTQASDNPAVASQLGRDPRANQNINAIYDPQSGTAFLNVQKHLNAPEPVCGRAPHGSA